MTEPSKASKFLQLFGFVYFSFNVVLFVVIFIMAVYTTGRYLQFSPGWVYLLFPALGMFSGYWIRIGKFGWARGLAITASMICTAAFLFIALVAAPQMEELKTEKFKMMQMDKQQRLDEQTRLLFVGVYGSEPELVRKQLAAGVDANAINETGRTALHVTQNVEIADLLIRHGANIHAKDDSGDTPIFNKEVAIAEILLDAGVDINATTEKGNTLLIIYSYAGYLEGIRFLVARGAKISVCNTDKHNALDIAEHFHPQSDMLRYLQSLDFQPCQPSD